MTSKNYTAAEKHFIKKQEQYERQIKYLHNTTTEQAASLAELTALNQKLIGENTQLKDWIDRLLVYTELSKEDIKAACGKDKKMSEFFDVFNAFSKYQF